MAVSDGGPRFQQQRAASGTGVNAGMKWEWGVVLLAALASGTASADEGMWTLDKLPLRHLEQAYGFKPDAAWILHAQRSAVRLAGGCSGSFVSPQGLVLTNRHCVSACVQQLSTAKDDLEEHGFYAAAVGEEKPCATFELNRLDDIIDVTARMQTALAGLEGEAYGKAMQSEQARLETDCVGADGDTVRCDLVMLHQGGVYNLYKYRRYQDVRLVFAPEDGVWPPCGTQEIDFPCHSLDMALLRAYEKGKPAQVRDWFAFARAGVKEEALTMLLGHPGFTERLRTVAQVERRLDSDLLSSLQLLLEKRGMLGRFAAESPEHARISREDRADVRHAVSRYRLQAAALRDRGFRDAKRRQEAELRAYVDADPALKARYGDAWDEIAKAQDWYRANWSRSAFVEIGSGFDTAYFNHARLLVQGAAEREKPNVERLFEFTDSSLPVIRHLLLADTPLHPALEQAKLGLSLAQMYEWLGPDDPVVKAVLGGDTPDAVAARLVEGTRLGDAAVRKALWDGGQAAIEASDDPFIVLARRIDGASRAIRGDVESKLIAVQDKQQGRIAQARFAKDGTASYPDATFSLRLSDGVVRGWTSATDERFPAFATIGGAFAAAGGPGAMKMPERWRKAKASLDQSRPLNFISTNDGVGGNSGSPLINAKGEIVGLFFAGTLGGESGAFWYDARLNRGVSVDTGGMLDVLDKVYGARRVLDEIEVARTPVAVH